MGLWNMFSNEFVDIIEWLDDSHETLVYRYERSDNEIKYGAKLIVREGQVAVFVNKGQAQKTIDMDILEPTDVFEPGTYTLDTQNLPILSKLQGWKYGFSSPFKSEVYFFNTTRFGNQKWGTPNPVMLRDPEFGVVRLRAFGTYSLKIKSAVKFLREVVGTDGHFKIDEIADQLRALIVSRFTDVLGEKKIPALDLAANYNEMGEFIAQQIRPEFDEFGLELVKFMISNISVPPEVEKALDKRSAMGIIGDMGKYTQYQTAEAIGDMGQNAHVGIINTHTTQAAPPPQPSHHAPVAPPPLPPQISFHVALNGQTVGPFDFSTLFQYVQQGQLTRDTLVWKQGMANWTPAGQVSELNGLFAHMPPPLRM